MSEASAEGPGSALREAREGMEVSSREVADALNLPVRVIEALEADDYDQLPPTVFTRGYLRSYARLLELPADDLLARYPEVEHEADALVVEQAGESRDQRKLQWLIGAGVLILVTVILLVWLQPGAEQPIAEQPVTEQPVTEEPPPASPENGLLRAAADAGPAADDLNVAVEVEAKVPQTVPPPVDRPVVMPQLALEQAPTAEQPEVPAPGSTAEKPPTLDDRSGITADPTAATLTSLPAGSRRERRITEFGDDRLMFSFTEDCWVEVRSEQGENLYSDLNRSGQTLILNGQAPFRILLGYAPGVTLAFNGEPVEVVRYTRNNVATLVLGR